MAMRRRRRGRGEDGGVVILWVRRRRREASPPRGMGVSGAWCARARGESRDGGGKRKNWLQGGIELVRRFDLKWNGIERCKKKKKDGTVE